MKYWENVAIIMRHINKDFYRPFISWFLLLTLLAGCGSGTEGDSGKTADSEGGNRTTSVNVTGIWYGTYSTSVVPQSQQAELKLSLLQDGTNLKDNTWERLFSISGCGAGNVIGILNGIVSENTFNFTVNESWYSFSGTFSGKGTASDNTINLSFQGSDSCGTHANGQAVLTKQQY